ncbi:PQQ-like beta-propeller repeat protein [Candidatus Fermentibacterales bacterium]|nr:PQQ-like beta-propeller repeat protein [Candidatus Fermentibacterales bacterium]
MKISSPAVLFLALLLPPAAIAGFSAAIEVLDDYLSDLPCVASTSEGRSACCILQVMEEPWVMVFGPAGELDWARPFPNPAGSRALESGGWLLPAGEDGLYLGVYSEPRATGINSDYAVFRTTPQGAIDLEMVIGEGTDRVYHGEGLAEGPDDGFLLVRAENWYEHPPVAVRYSAEGLPIWSVGLPMEAFNTHALEWASGSWLLCGRDHYEDEEVLLRLQTNGEFAWSVALPEDSGKPVALGLTDLGYAVCTIAEYGSRAYLLLVMEGGDAVRSFEIDLPEGVEVSDAAFVDGDRLALAGTLGENGGSDGWLAMLDVSDAAISWSRTYGSPDGPDGFDCIAPGAEGGFVLGGTTSLPDGQQRFWLLCVDPDGSVAGEQSGTGLTSPETVVHAPMRFPVGWVLACSTFETEQEAMARAIVLSSLTGLEPGALWIPDWPSLSGYEAWLAYLGPVYRRCVSPGSLEALAEVCPDAYVIWAGMSFERRTLPMEYLQEE